MGEQGVKNLLENVHMRVKGVGKANGPVGRTELGIIYIVL